MMYRAMIGALAIFAFGAARAQEAPFPNKTLNIVIGSSAGSAVEFEARVISDAFVKRGWPALQPDLRPGAMGGIGATAVYRAKPDGYTLLLSPASPMVFNPVTHKTLTYDPAKMTPVILIGEQPLVLVARGNFPAKTIDEFVAWVKQNPGKTFYSSPGIGGGNHMSVLLFARHAGIDVKHVPFPGAGPATQAILRGEVDFGIISASTLLPWYRDGKLKFFAMGTKERYREAPNAPTFRELGYPEEFVLTAWRVIVGPPDMPEPLVETLNGVLNKALKDPVAIEKFRAIGVEPTPGSPQAVAAMLRREAATWAKVAAENNIEKEDVK
jgi:tripartite-type tricarboxylate transporter receptor subunit TctC